MKMAVFGDEIRDLGGSSSKRGDFKDEEGRLWGSSTEMGLFEDEIPSGRGPAAISVPPAGVLANRNHSQPSVLRNSCLFSLYVVR